MERDIYDVIRDIYDADNTHDIKSSVGVENFKGINNIQRPLERNNNSNISLEQAEEIRNKYLTQEDGFKTIKQIAKRYNSNYNTIYRITKNLSHVIDYDQLLGYQKHSRNEAQKKYSRQQLHKNKTYNYYVPNGKPFGPPPKPSTPEYFWGLTGRDRLPADTRDQICWPWYRSGKNPRIRWKGIASSPLRIAAALSGLIPEELISARILPTGSTTYNIHHTCPNKFNELDILCCNPKHFKIITYTIPIRLKSYLNINQTYKLREYYLNKHSIEECMEEFNISKTLCEYILNKRSTL